MCCKHPHRRGRLCFSQAHSTAESTSTIGYYAPGNNELVMVVTHRLLDPQGHLVAVLGGQLDLTILGEIMLARSGLGDSGETYLVSLESH
jgi:hypothetical protein